jgi:hypothetical protein
MGCSGSREVALRLDLCPFAGLKVHDMDIIGSSSKSDACKRTNSALAVTEGKTNSEKSLNDSTVAPAAVAAGCVPPSGPSRAVAPPAGAQTRFELGMGRIDTTFEHRSVFEQRTKHDQLGR